MYNFECYFIYKGEKRMKKQVATLMSAVTLINATNVPSLLVYATDNNKPVIEQAKIEDGEMLKTNVEESNSNSLQQENIIPDPALRLAINNSLGRKESTDITKEDLESLVHLNYDILASILQNVHLWQTHLNT